MRAWGRTWWERWLELPRLERLLLLGAIATGVGVVLIYIFATRPHELRGDEPSYDEMARFWADGKLWWSTLPLGEAQASAWKAPLYPAFIGTVYATAGESPLRVEIIQSLFAGVTVALTWALGRRLFNPVVGIVAAWVVAIYPLAFDYYALLFPEALAIPLTMAAFLVFLDRPPTPKIAVGAGLLIGLGLLTRPTSAFLLVAMVVSFIAHAGWARGLRLGALGAACAILLVLPWTARNAVEFDGFIPISIQDAATYGTFNPETAADTENRWAWRAFLEDQPEILTDPPPGTTDADIRRELQSQSLEYIKDNPSSVAKAAFWNGVVRFWDLRRPADAVREADFQSRSRDLRWVGLGLYYVLGLTALVGLWKARSRSRLIVPLLAMVFTITLLFATIGGTRYRAPLEPLIVILAASALPLSARRLEDRGDRVAASAA